MKAATRPTSRSATLPLATFIVVTIWIMAFFVPVSVLQAGKWEYPSARKADVTDNFHGTIVTDPYRWMEDPEAEETIAWVDAQNRVTREYINSYPGHDAIFSRMKDLWNYPKYSLPRKEGDRYFFEKNNGLQNQSVLYMQKSLSGEAVEIIDPNKLSEDGTVALRNQSYSIDGTLLAYGLSTSGSDRQEIRIREIDTGIDYPEVIKFVKFAGIAWKHDNSGFFYNRFPEPGTVPEEDLNNYSSVYWHRTKSPQSQDVLVHSDPEHKEIGFWPYMTDDGKYLCMYVYHGTDSRNGIYLRDVESTGDFMKVMEVGEAKFDPIDNVGTTFYFNTDLDSPKGRIIAVDITHPERENWKTIVEESENPLAFVSMVNNQFVIAYMKDAHHELAVHDIDGSFVREIELPTMGSIRGLRGKRTDSEMLFGFTSFLYPFTSLRYDFASNETTVFRTSEIDFDPSRFETKQLFYTSKDGTRIPMFVTHKKGLELDGQNPTILYGYGGFNISMTPRFSITRLVWLENGGVYAVANLRGGDEYGEDWHQAGMLDRKQNVFDDFIAGAEFLIKEKYTNSSKLAINGGSNGGLLVAVCMLQRPELFGAVLCQVPVTDMLRYHKFTVGRYWVPEYGNAEENPEHFEFMVAYSPLHNVKEGMTCPATLITTADTDDRVVPMHAKKFTAELQAKDSGANPILIRIETKAGHGAGKPTTKIIEEYTDIYAFLFKTFGMESPVLGQN